MVIHTQGPAETQAAAQRLAPLLRPGDLIAYRGGMGAGKTTFTAGLARGLGSTAWVSSPTFALVNQYRSAAGDRIYHFDFYRIDTPAEAYDLGYEEYFYSGDLCLVEWPEKIEELLPDDVMTVRIEVDGETSRTFRID